MIAPFIVIEKCIIFHPIYLIVSGKSFQWDVKRESSYTVL